MSDDVLPNQLRGMGGCEPGCGCILCEAADEIERLREQLRLANIDACNLQSEVEEKDRHIEGLKMLLEDADEWGR